VIGQAVSHYRVLRALGGGGMGVVYEAEDTRLGRRVALKFLTEKYLQEDSARERFLREARAASSLNHPNICTIFDTGEHEGRPFIAMELLDGATLADRIDRQPLAIDDIIRWAIQIADALGVSHETGVVHRDIKPANIFITARGNAKILDFGIARVGALALDLEARTATAPPLLTSPGVTPGTLPYMSPEQVLGKPLDARTDLFSLGTVLYEMSTGKRLFDGDSAAAVSNRILNETPPSPLRSNPRLPDEFGRVVLKCLEKDRELRYQSARELLADLRRVERDRTSGRPTSAEDEGRGQPGLKRWLLVGAIAALALGGWLWQRSRGTPRPAARVVPITADGGFKLAPRLSPDGERVAYAWTGPADDNWDIYTKSIGPGTKPLRLTESAAVDWSPVWSPDGREIAFLRQSGVPDCEGRDVCVYSLYTLPSLGGQERKLVDVAAPALPPPTFSWSSDGRWLAVPETPEGGPSRIVRVDLATLEKTPLTFPPATSAGDFSPEISPDGQTLAFVRGASRDSGHLVGGRDLWFQPLPGGDAQQLTFARYDWCCQLTWTARSDELVFATGNPILPRSIFRVARSGGAPTLIEGVGENVAFPSARAGRLVFSQHVRRVPIEIWKTPGRKAPPASRIPQRLVFSSRDDFQPQYSPDARKIAFTSTRSGSENVWVVDADGRNPVQLTSYASHSAKSPHWSPDGRTIAFESRESGDPDIYVVDAEGGVPRPLTREPSEDTGPSFSRDGRFIYFSSNRSGRPETWRIPAEGGPVAQVTRRGGGSGQESWDGRYFYYTRGRESGVVWRVPVGGGAEEEVLHRPFDQDQWTLTRTGIYYATTRWPLRFRRDEATVHFFDFQSGRDASVYTQAGPIWPSLLSVSFDEEWILRHQYLLPQSELMLVENFH
jgi:eukaryotic-like serine/threonine-protein kinase